MSTNDNEHIIAKHGDYVRRTHRGDMIVVQYRSDTDEWVDFVATNQDEYDESRGHAKRLQIAQERHRDIETPYTCHHCNTHIPLTHTVHEHGHAWHPHCPRSAST